MSGSPPLPYLRNWDNLFPHCVPYSKEKRNGGKKNAETEPYRKSSRICGKGVREIYILFCFMVFFPFSFLGSQKEKSWVWDQSDKATVRYSESSSQIMIPVLYNCWKKSSFALPESRYNKMMLVPCFYSCAHTILRLRLHLELIGFF